MERLFSPCTRLHALLESQGLRLRYWEIFEELNLDILENADTVAWLAPHAAVVRVRTNNGGGGYFWGQMDGSCSFCFDADGKEIIALARSPEHLLEICDVVLRLLAASVVHSVILNKGGSPADAGINASTLAYLMEQCQSLKVFKLLGLESLDENHCRVLGAHSRPDLEIELKYCKLTSAGENALAEALGRNQGPTKLECLLSQMGCA
jgi:hypothetical protein